MGEEWGLFTGLRSVGSPSWYGEQRTSVVVDIHALICSLSFGLVALGFLLIVPGIVHRLYLAL